MLRNMTETPPSSDPDTTPVAPPVAQEPRRPSRLMQTAAWVGITAGIVFIVAVVFGTGFFLGAHSDGGHYRGGGGWHDRHGMMMYHRDGPPHMFGGPEMGPGAPAFGPGGAGGIRPGTERPGAPQSPQTTAPAQP